MKISRLSGYTPQTLANGTAMSTMGLISTSGKRICFSVNTIGKGLSDSILVNKTDCGAAPQFPSQENSEQAYTCVDKHCYE